MWDPNMRTEWIFIIKINGENKPALEDFGSVDVNGEEKGHESNQC